MVEDCVVVSRKVRPTSGGKSGVDHGFRARGRACERCPTASRSECRFAFHSPLFLVVSLGLGYRYHAGDYR
jgi:hypothetical protein